MRSPLHLARIVLAFAWLACAPACGRGGSKSATNAAQRRPNILLVTLDTTRADRLGCYGFGPARTPRLDALAREGVRVEHAVAVAPITAPSHASMLSGLYPTAHGVRDNGAYALPDDVETLPEILRAHGYETRAFVSAAVLSRRYNLAQGFQTYDDELWSEDAPSMFMIRERPGRRTVDRALAWLHDWKAHRAKTPFFAWVHLFDAHEPHKPELGDRLLAPTGYDAELAGVDRQVGRLLDALATAGELENTVVLVTADHGESLGEHGEDTHAVFVYESTVHVPFLVRFPRVLGRARVYAGPVRGVDVMPTLLAAVGVRPVVNIDGRNLWDALRTNRPIDLPQYSESMVSELGFGMAPLFSLRHGSYTYVRAPRPELYDRATDPHELRDLSATMPDKLRELDRALDALLAESAAHSHGGASSTIPLDRETLENLRALGYVGDSATAHAVAGMDPKDGIRIYESLHLARALARSERWREAAELAQQVLGRTPSNEAALNLLAMSQQRLGDEAAARATYALALTRNPSEVRPLLALALMDLAAGQLDDAARKLDQALAARPEFVEAVVARGFVALTKGQAAEAEAYYERALRLDPSFPRALQMYADLSFRRGDFANALRYYERAIAAYPRGFEALNQAGASARRLGRAEDAIAFYRRAAGVRPDSWVPPYNIACALALQGKADDAFRALEDAITRGPPPVSVLEGDADFAALRQDPRFVRLLARAER